MPWRPLRPGVYRGMAQPMLSIQKSGALTWNQSAHAALGEPAQVEILFDAERRLLGLRKAARPEGSFRVRRLGPQNTWITSARGALRRIGLLPSSAFRRVAQAADDMLVIDVGDLLIGASAESGVMSPRAPAGT